MVSWIDCKGIGSSNCTITLYKDSCSWNVNFPWKYRNLFMHPKYPPYSLDHIFASLPSVVFDLSIISFAVRQVGPLASFHPSRPSG